MTTAVYQSSKGPKVITDLPYSYLKNAHAKLLREEPERADEIAAMGADIARRDAAYAEGGDAPAGHNMPPAETMVEAPKAAPIMPATLAEHTEHFAVLDTEARNWADGQAVETVEQAAEVDRLIALVKASIRSAEGTRDAEKKPFADKVNEIQTAYQPLVGDTTKVKGIGPRALVALLAVKTKWGAELTRRNEAAAKAQRAEAFATAAKARDIIAESPDNIAAIETAQDMIGAAKGALKGAATIEKPVTGGFRDNWVIDGFDDKDGDGRVVLMRHYFKANPAALVEFCLGLARTDIRSGLRNIPGIVIKNDRRAF